MHTMNSVALQQTLPQKKAYTAPSIAPLGSVVAQTLGSTEGDTSEVRTFTGAVIWT